MIDENTIRECTDAENQMIDTFEELRNSVDAVPLAIIAKAEELRASIGPEKYEPIVIEAIQNIGCKSLPSNATEFLESLNLSLQVGGTNLAAQF